ncbi:MAG: NlpC/P60 family protein [Hyphomonas sp.]|nr:NlpC/P60 family protein [Hyphomonas sp.]
MPDFNDVRLKRPEGAGIGFQVTAGVAAIRETPAPDGRLGTQALHGEMLDVFREEGAFGLCQLRRDRFTGWVNMDALSSPALPVTHKVSALRTYCFSEPDLKSAPRFMLCLGARVAARGRTEGPWVECERAGWVHQRHLAVLTAFETDPAGVAERYLETPYLWGGRESLGLDCSGLIQQAFEACGVILPRDSDMQAAWAGEPVADWQAPGKLRRGDLVFWNSHAGILTAPETLLHANAFHVAVAREPLDKAIARIRKVEGEVTGVRRVSLAPGATPDWLKAG